MIEKAIVMAAGLGTRLSPLTDETPKPLIEISGRPIIATILDFLSQAGVKECIVNTHHLFEKVDEFLKTIHAPKTHISYESEILDTGGGIKRVIDFFDNKPFLHSNADIWITDSTPFTNMVDHWDDEKMDALLTLIPIEHAVGYTGNGDYFFFEDGRIKRDQTRRASNTRKYVYAGMTLVHPRAFDSFAGEKFSRIDVFDKAEETGRLYGIMYDGYWGDIGSLDALRQVRSDALKHIQTPGL